MDCGRDTIAKFVGIDGEGWTDGDQHHYVLLAASTGAWAFDPNGLSTVRCFEFLLELPRKTVKCGFGFNYDVNMMLKDVPLEPLIKLYKEGSTKWSSYYLEWIPGKSFLIKSHGRVAKIFDVFGFFQSSFVKALGKWNLTIPEDMEEMKKARQSFDAGMKRLIIDYCLDECQSLVQLMDELENALNEVDLNVSNWIGAGAIASALMKQNNVREHHKYDSEWPNVEPSIFSAYFGGRVELFRQGIFDRVWDYDISSAYPSVALELPSLKDCEWRWVHDYDPELQWCIWDCQWNLSDSFLCPFPVRRKGAIYYPRNGRGWYHSTEVASAQKLTGDRIEVVGGWQLQPTCDVKPFAFIPMTYAHRLDLKREKHAGEKVLKLGLNSIYGKLAQGAGFQGKPPLFQSFFWAGAITAGTRARVLEIAMSNIDDLIMIATDGIFFKRDSELEITGGLGGLELSTMDDMFVAQAGVYQATVDGDDGKEIYARSRGFFTTEIDFDDLREGFKNEGIVYSGSYSSEKGRFCGLGSSLISKRLGTWRKWVHPERNLSLHPSRKFVKDYDAYPVVDLIPPMFGEAPTSEPYKPKPGFATLTESELEGLLEYIQGTEQPMKEY